MELVFAALGVLALGLSIWNLANGFSLSRVLEDEADVGDRRDEEYREAFLGLSEEMDSAREQISAMALKIAELEKKLGELPTEEIEAEYRNLAAFNEGVQNILGFGANIPKLNKEGVKRG